MLLLRDKLLEIEEALYRVEKENKLLKSNKSNR